MSDIQNQKVASAVLASRIDQNVSESNYRQFAYDCALQAATITRAELEAVFELETLLSSSTKKQVELTAERDELLATLEKVTAKLAWLNSDDCGHIMALTDESEALIASVKGSAA